MSDKLKEGDRVNTQYDGEGSKRLNVPKTEFVAPPTLKLNDNKKK